LPKQQLVEFPLLINFKFFLSASTSTHQEHRWHHRCNNDVIMCSCTCTH